MKLEYPNDGVYGYTKTQIESCISSLNTAASRCSFSIPGGFRYASYLATLSTTIRGFHNEASSIKDTLNKVDNSYETLEQDIIQDIKNSEKIKIKERDRMIY